MREHLPRTVLRHIDEVIRALHKRLLPFAVTVGPDVEQLSKLGLVGCKLLEACLANRIRPVDLAAEFGRGRFFPFDFRFQLLDPALCTLGHITDAEPAAIAAAHVDLMLQRLDSSNPFLDLLPHAPLAHAALLIRLLVFLNLLEYVHDLPAARRPQAINGVENVGQRFHPALEVEHPAIHLVEDILQPGKGIRVRQIDDFLGKLLALLHEPGAEVLECEKALAVVALGMLDVVSELRRDHGFRLVRIASAKNQSVKGVVFHRRDGRCIVALRIGVRIDTP